MISFAPSIRVRRILIVLLAFLLAAAFAVAASTAPAQADDAKQFKVFVGEAPPLGVPPAGDTQVTVEQGEDIALIFTFENPDEDTNTQQAGSFQVVLPAGFENLETGAITLTPASGPNQDASGTWTADTTGSDTVVLFANSGGDRLGIDEKISLEVTFDATTLGTFGPSDFMITADQQAGGPPDGGGNTFVQANDSPTITVVCGAGQQCSVSVSGANNDTGTAACDPVEGCDKAGALEISFQGTDQDCGDGNVDCNLWFAANFTGGDDFYLIIDTGGVSNVKIYAEQFDSDGNDLGFVGRAHNCKPPARNFGCVDTSHTEYDRKAGIFPIRFPGGIDPPGGYR